MYIPVPSITLLSLLCAISPTPGLAQSDIDPWRMAGVPRFTVTADTPSPVSEVRISPGRGVLFVFDTAVRRDGIMLAERTLFRQISLSEDGLLLTLMPSGGLPLGKRLNLTVRFADEELPLSMDFTLAVSTQAEPQVEIYRHTRSGDFLQREAGETRARLQQCQTDLERERLKRDKPPGLLGLIALNQLGAEGVLSKSITKEIELHRGEAFKIKQAITHRAPSGEVGDPVVRLAVDLMVLNTGTQPWIPVGAQLVGPSGPWEAELWPPEPILPGQNRRILVEVELAGAEIPNPCLLKFWDAEGSRTLTLSGVTFP
jgi:uncharacterized protein (TIGR02268 family)